ncbi:DNA-binding transcriptional LysR family regulator [Nocardioides thalensis]|uniref:DNA-binding transcriptional LysR family regulator n=1 Tax=Nocardioides thalensis TaxID=1914755 RepID=A0A853BYW8_9ACTN|nr:LysR family transcriptional regulator [Nocardioides thalensis]NYJ00415.1 DNA-binding transcriptional LysR family regulator [Nocardioides thalensis]
MVLHGLRRLRMLHELEERGTLAAVAASLGYTPSAVSQQLALLEKEVGARLLEKAGRGVRLTDAGRLLAAHAATMLAAAEAAQTDLESLTGDVRGTVRAGGLQSATRHLLIPVLTELQETHPGVRLELTELELEEALPELRLGTLHLSISDEYSGHPRPRPPGLHYETILDEPLKLVLPAGHRLATATTVDVADLRDDVWVASAATTGHHALVLATCRSAGGFDPDVRHRSNDADVQLALVRSAGAVALLPALVLPPDDPALAIRDVARAEVGRRLVAITGDRAHAPALDAVLGAIRNQATRITTGPRRRRR